MKRDKRLVLVSIAIVGALALGWAGVQLWLWRSPLVVLGRNKPGGEVFDPQTAVGRVFHEVQECGEQQKNLYKCIVAYKDKYGRVPKDMKELFNGVRESWSFDDCPNTPTGYVVHFESFGDAEAVLIEGRKNKHSTALKLWLRGIEPCVKTMGDGTIHLFEGGKIAIIDASQN